MAATRLLKERLFGLTNAEGNHGEDVKEYYFYLDSTPTHSYMKYLYKYPQAAFPYDDLVQTNQQRTADDFEYELLNTGVFDADRYFDVFVEYAKETPEDILVQITAYNRGPEKATLHVLPTLWFRNTWSWSDGRLKPNLRQSEGGKGYSVIEASHPDQGERYLYVSGAAPLLFTDNETNTARLFGHPNATPYVKDGINDAVVAGKQDAVNPAQTGTKAAPHIDLSLDPGQSQVIRLRLTEIGPLSLSASYPAKGNPFGRHFDTVMKTRREEADAFYAEKTPAGLSDDEKNVMRQALAGMLWSKQFYNYDVTRVAKRARSRRSRQPAACLYPQQRLVLYGERRHHLHAGQVGVSLVCGMGSGVSHRCACQRRSRLRQRPTGVDAE